MTRRDDTRALPREIFAAEANPIPDEREGTLTVALHHLEHFRNYRRPLADAGGSETAP